MASVVAYRLAHAGFHSGLPRRPTPGVRRRQLLRAFTTAARSWKAAPPARFRALGGRSLWARAELPCSSTAHDCRRRLFCFCLPAAMSCVRLVPSATPVAQGMAPLTMVGARLPAPDEVDLAIETNRGHNLGRLITQARPAQTGCRQYRRFTSERCCALRPRGVRDRFGPGAPVAGARCWPGWPPAIEAQVAVTLRVLLRLGPRVARGTKVGTWTPGAAWITCTPSREGPAPWGARCWKASLRPTTANPPQFRGGPLSCRGQRPH